jgi:hypothetical protein
LKEIKRKYVEKFEAEINALTEVEKRSFYAKHYSLLLESAIYSNRIENIEDIIKSIHPYKSLRRKEKLLIFMVRVNFYKSKPYRAIGKFLTWLRKFKRRGIEKAISNDKWAFIFEQLS